MEKWEVLSLGGSLVCPGEIDFEFLKKFKKFILSFLKRGKKFVIVVGGGKIARKYQSIGKKFGAKSEDLDWLGIFSTWLNANLVRLVFGKFAFQKIVNSPFKKIKTKKKILIVGGWKPGHSTDFDAVLWARKLRAKVVINLSNIDFVFEKDPKKSKNPKPLKNISFRKFLKIVGEKWTPGANLPFDPIAAKLAEKNKIKIVVLNGKNFGNLKRFFQGQDFKGTIIQ